MDTKLWIALNKKMNMIWHCLKLNYLTTTLFTNLTYDLLKVILNIVTDYISSILRAPDNVVFT